jgi:hypothetical protein
VRAILLEVIAVKVSESAVPITGNAFMLEDDRLLGTW